MTDDAFLGRITERLAELPTVRAVTLGGSRAEGTHTETSDWDLALYYRGAFDPATLRAVGWRGEVSEIGGWGGGVFNGGAWLTVEDRRVDVHYRDLDTVEREVAEAEKGRFHQEPLLFHLAGIPSYLLVAELALSRTLHGTLPHPAYPEALRRTAPPRWWGSASATLAYAAANHAPRGRHTETTGLIATAAVQTAHAILAAKGEWITNEKRLLDRAALRGIDTLLATTAPTPEVLVETVAGAEELLTTALRKVHAVGGEAHPR
ncbi:nucleotidyltransferase domain-containing protein [Streptomyces tsukubensis]|uniref:DNA polymerase subunit beta n=1 Tax=Streptomyces tsukubensis TaxID=83656 RepID=A0A1V4A4B1_9ACTN|nr:nucleotidyltransferase domain-containing protein [Streptomyces tsukubensis]OON74686.1 DNA polymerase subunit beta [Streptomyces tsukubensis]QFR93041.1 nucleotidyltransferase domain-containing protein [Streptomyces tsukubensis]